MRAYTLFELFNLLHRMQTTLGIFNYSPVVKYDTAITNSF